MRHKKDIRKLSRNKSQRKALIRNMSISFFEHKQIKTTEAKAKELRRTVEKLITVGKKKDLASLRHINSVLNHSPSLSRVKDISDKYMDRNGGYTQIIKLAPRRGDSAEMVIIKLV
ncbi:MAG TPA: 50S ribosomal protein L17 [bacterium]|nr:50S ribosomal protein L17 [bacterium]